MILKKFHFMTDAALFGEILVAVNAWNDKWNDGSLGSGLWEDDRFDLTARIFAHLTGKEKVPR